MSSHGEVPSRGGGLLAPLPLQPPLQLEHLAKPHLLRRVPPRTLTLCRRPLRPLRWRRRGLHPPRHLCQSLHLPARTVLANCPKVLGPAWALPNVCRHGPRERDLCGHLYSDSRAIVASLRSPLYACAGALATCLGNPLYSRAGALANCLRIFAAAGGAGRSHDSLNLCIRPPRSKRSPMLICFRRCPRCLCWC